jgi:hypothetical protein
MRRRQRRVHSLYELRKTRAESLRGNFEGDVSKIYPELLRSVLALVSEVEQNDNSLYTVG